MQAAGREQLHGRYLADTWQLPGSTDGNWPLKQGTACCIRLSAPRTDNCSEFDQVGASTLCYYEDGPGLRRTRTEHC